ncbi:glycosyltransferase [Shewanella eurypsychrophilus]|uniref:Glycosyltransferase n=1 Tax=Shewanella eurypsychrophilus TaxID=2593656 RepID=A0ABX6VAU5_9GAMM|nr:MULTISPECIES: glycosyltransferase family 2 protein [Shewanella]QFU23436.1 glycosyltransferase [Shewanella sp. YLB-09]QPG58664.1 glycosyltransferase [Shewanella eurypsychrophilus]
MYSISVVIPLYNKAQYIERAIDSIAKQTIAVDEIIIVDDGSTDGSAEIVASRFPKVTLIRQVNQGVSVARNTGIEHANTEFIAFLDADDYWDASFIANIFELMNIDKTAGLYCTHYSFVENKRVIAAKLKGMPGKPGYITDYFSSCFNADLPITASSVCIRRAILLDIAGFPVGMKMGEDQVVWSKVACRSRIMFHPQSCVFYDLTVSGSACDLNQVIVPAPQLAIFDTMLADGEVPIELQKGLKDLMHLTVMSCVKNNLVLGDKKAAMRLLLSSSFLKVDFYRFVGMLALLVPKSIFYKLYTFAKNRR